VERVMQLDLCVIKTDTLKSVCFACFHSTVVYGIIFWVTHLEANNNNNNNNNNNSKLNLKKRKIFQKYKVTNTKEIAQLIENLKQKIQAKAQRIRRYEKGKTNTSKTNCSNKTLSNSTDIWEQRLLR
jgi:hypothetical protein